MIGTSWADPWMGNSDCGTSRRRRWPCGTRYPVSSPLPTSATTESLLWPALTTENVSSTLQRWIPSYMNPNQSTRLIPKYLFSNEFIFLIYDLLYQPIYEIWQIFEVWMHIFTAARSKPVLGDDRNQNNIVVHVLH